MPTWSTSFSFCWSIRSFSSNLKATHHEELTTKTIETLKQEERFRKDAVIVYAEKYFAVFDLDEYTDIILDLREKPPERMRHWIKKFRKKKIRAP